MALYTASGDTRPYCSDLDTGIDQLDLLCVDPREECEIESYLDEVRSLTLIAVKLLGRQICYVGNHFEASAICISWVLVLLATLYSALLHFALDILLM